MSISHHFKAFTPSVIWDLSYTEWLIYAAAADSADADLEKRAREARAQSRGRRR